MLLEKASLFLEINGDVLSFKLSAYFKVHLFKNKKLSCLELQTSTVITLQKENIKL